MDSEPASDSGETTGRVLALTDRLYIPYRKRLSHSFVTNDEGLRELPRPRRPFTVRDHRAIFLMAPRVRRFPYLFDVIKNELGIRIECTAQTIEISLQEAV